MAKRRHAKPSDPEAARLARRAKDLALVGMQPEAAALPQHDMVEMTRMAEDTGAGKKAGHHVARRMDAFDALKDGMQPGAYDAARRLEREILESRLEGDKGRRMERVDCAKADEKEFKFVLAADNVKGVSQRLSPRDFWLLRELIIPSKEYAGGWRGVVAYVTGEDNKDAQGAVVRSACVNLRDVYEALERREAA
jgi:hypothetical protein